MDETAITGTVDRTGGVTSLLSQNDRATMSRSEFLQILIAELSNQDPFQPMDNAQFAQQVAQIESMRSSEELTDNIAALLKQQQMTSAGALIGKVVRGGTAGGDVVEGTVQRVTVDSNGVSLIIDGVSVPLENVFEIKTAE
jgi:flagellar basal-body rod modification protein FlgD